MDILCVVGQDLTVCFHLLIPMEPGDILVNAQYRHIFILLLNLEDYWNILDWEASNKYFDLWWNKAMANETLFKMGCLHMF